MATVYTFADWQRCVCLQVDLNGNGELNAAELTELLHLLSSSSNRTELLSYTADQESENIESRWSVRICEDAVLLSNLMRQPEAHGHARLDSESPWAETSTLAAVLCGLKGLNQVDLQCEGQHVVRAHLTCPILFLLLCTARLLSSSTRSTCRC